VDIYPENQNFRKFDAKSGGFMLITQNNNISNSLPFFLNTQKLQLWMEQKLAPIG
jgi:hypothetical protein